MTDPERGLFLAFEGVEGSGKTTQVARLAAWLRARGADVVVAREPGSTPLGERVREIVLSPDLHVPARSELFLMLAARAAFVEQVVKPGVQAGKVVIADRFELSTLAYQGAGRGLPLDEVEACNRMATGGLAPDATLLMDVDPEVGAERQRVAGKAADRLEREEAAFHRRVAEGYRRHEARVAGIVRIDAVGGEEQVHRRVLQALAARFPETFPAAQVIRE
ncbi:dTMP kinase [Longimicrobium sp.]|jgi:dTMP kinase|uniref:dTMP kinase n=1 Tax=Longimicrobium sp. TaxID=2029185 RepID=UPI002F93CB84